MGKMTDQKILGMTRRELFILGSLGGLLLCVVLAFLGYIFYDQNRPVQTVVGLPTQTNIIVLQPTDLPSVQASITPVLPIIETPRPTVTAFSVNTKPPFIPGDYVYEGVTTYCTCTDCICVTNQAFIVRLSIDPQGKISGIFEKYLERMPPIKLKGVLTNITGTGKDIHGEPDFQDFVGNLSKDLKILNATLSFRGPNGTGKREIYFTRK
ncbi:MAG: hypothetical protein WCK35_13955 [Chloroflexota bacterium]